MMMMMMMMMMVVVVVVVVVVIIQFSSKYSMYFYFSIFISVLFSLVVPSYWLNGLIWLVSWLTDWSPVSVSRPPSSVIHKKNMLSIRARAQQ